MVSVICHDDKDAMWSDSWVRKWYPRDYQAPVMERASLLDAARKRDWKRLPEMLEGITRAQHGAIYRASLVRLIRGCQDESKWPVLVNALEDDSPLVRSSAASALAGHLNDRTLPKLLAATRDPSRLVRIRAVMAMAPIPPGRIQDSKDRESFKRAIEEFTTSMTARPDDWAGHANLGTFHMEQRQFQKAVECFETATRLEPRMVGPMVNASMAYSNLRQNDKAKSSLRAALQVEPNNPAALFNLGLLLAEERQITEAEEALRAALKADPQLAAAAFNLGILCGKARIEEAVQWCGRAHELEPGNAKYTHTLAFFLREKGEVDRAIEILRDLIDRQGSAIDAYLLLGEIYERKGERTEAAEVYRRALAVPDLPLSIQSQLKAKVRSLTESR
jgi:tetratricopeptide (TPR) repeat protein